MDSCGFSQSSVSSDQKGEKNYFPVAPCILFILDSSFMFHTKFVPEPESLFYLSLQRCQGKEPVVLLPLASRHRSLRHWHRKRLLWPPHVPRENRQERQPLDRPPYG